MNIFSSLYFFSFPLIFAIDCLQVGAVGYSRLRALARERRRPTVYKKTEAAKNGCTPSNGNERSFDERREKQKSNQTVARSGRLIIVYTPENRRSNNRATAKHCRSAAPRVADARWRQADNRSGERRRPSPHLLEVVRTSRLLNANHKQHRSIS